MRMKFSVWIIAVFTITLEFCDVGESAKILAVFPMPAKSHYILGSKLMRGLAGKGHDVTVISPIGEKNPPKNTKYREVLTTNFMEPKAGEPGMNLFDMYDMNPVIYAVFMNFMGNNYTEETLKHPNVQKLLKSNEKFDVVIVEQFINDALKGFAHHFKAPLIIFSTFASNAWVNPLVGNPAPPSIVPEQMIKFDHLNFWHRLKNNLLYVMNELNRNLLFFPAQNAILQKYFPGAPDLNVLNYNASLVLLNSHWSTNQAVPRVPNMIDIGGYHMDPPKKLPKDLQDFLDASKEGVIYFSMGSALKSAQLPLEKRNAILKTFSKLKMKVLWKWEDDVLPGQPANVKLGKWLPQQDILAHPNIKLFITHGGLLSLIETVYNGVPILAIPIFGDQKMNAAGAANNGYAKYLDFNDLNEDTLAYHIDELLNNPSYRENVKRRSAVMHDRQVSPMDNIDYWIQYVIKHKGAPHLRVQSLDLRWYQYISLDVWLFLTVVTLISIYLGLLLLKKICSAICSRNKQSTDKKKPERKVKRN